MSDPWGRKFLILSLLVAFLMLSELEADAVRLPREFWEQMLPKQFPRPSSSPSKGTNSVSSSDPDPMKLDENLHTVDGNAQEHQPFQIAPVLDGSKENCEFFWERIEEAQLMIHSSPSSARSRSHVPVDLSDLLWKSDLKTCTCRYTRADTESNHSFEGFQRLPVIPC